MKRVNILISTYNGEQYIREQIDSILNQDYGNISIYVRDDGSNDGTVGILEQYEKAGKINLDKGTNVGFGRSFLMLLDKTKAGDYWAFADQDDVWFPDKISTAVYKLEKEREKKQIPMIYCCNYYDTDECLKNAVLHSLPAWEYTFEKAITECVHMGFAMTIDDKIREYALQADMSEPISHDHFIELIGMSKGCIIYDDTPLAYHRRLDLSLSGRSLHARFRWLRGVWNNKSEITPVASSFFTRFGDQIPAENSKTLELFCNKKYNLSAAAKKCFYMHRWRSSISSEIVLRMLMLFGKV